MTHPRATSVASIAINTIDPAERRLWQTVAAIAGQLGDDQRWCLVGGLMVALFAMQTAQTPRVTTDIDVRHRGGSRRIGRSESWAR